MQREQSSIGFPYQDLGVGIEVAQAIYQRSGLGSCDLDELAAEMGQTMSGSFRLKTGTARMFDLIERDGKSSVKLSELGRQIVSSETERPARVEAFLRVPLYSAIYEKYKGHLLPPAKALEREMQSLGVASKQTDKARQAFERSARLAYFFESGDDRLVRPRVGSGRIVDNDEKLENDNTQSEFSSSLNEKSVQGVAASIRHPFIEGLLQTLPDPEEPWSIADQAKWLQTAASIFGLIYKGGEGAITVSVSPAHKMNAATGH